MASLDMFNDKFLDMERRILLEINARVINQSRNEMVDFGGQTTKWSFSIM